MPRISVIITCYNLGAFIDEAVDSVLAQTFQDFEIIIVNDGSTDPETNSMLADYDKDKTIVLHTVNQGLPTARNYGIARADGEYICCLDGDDRLHPTYLEKCVRILDMDTEMKLGFVTSHVQCFGDSTAIWKSSSFSPFRLVTENLVHVSSVFRRRCWEIVGGFDPGLSAFEDWDFWLAIVAQGYEWAVIDEALFYYRDRPDSMLKQVTNKVELKVRIAQNRIDFLKSHIIDIICEYERLIVVLENYHRWLEKQISSWKIDYGGLSGQYYELQRWIQELEKAKIWLKENADKWMKACKGAQLAHKDVTEQLEVFRKKVDILQKEKQSSIRENRKLQTQLKNTHQDLHNIHSMLKDIYHSGTFRFASLFRDARYSRKYLAFLPLRILWFFVPERFKKHVKPIYCHTDTARRKKIRNRHYSKQKPLISVIIPCFNYGQYVLEAIDSALSQSFQNLEIIVVDGGSTDKQTIDILKHLQKPRTNVILREGRHLVGSNRNHGIAMAKGKYICCLDADDRLKPTYVEKALFYLETYHFDVVYPSVQAFEGIEEIWMVQPTTFLNSVEKYNFVSTVAIFRKKAWKKAGGYKDWPIGKEYVPEDWEFWSRLLGHGYRFKRLKEPLMEYRVKNFGLIAASEMDHEQQRRIIKQENIELFKPRNIKYIEKRTHTRFIVEKPFVNLKQHRFMEKRNILFAVPFMITGGAESMQIHIAEHLAKNDYNVHAVTTVSWNRAYGDNTQEFERFGGGVYHLPDFLEDEDEYRDFIHYMIETRHIDIVFLAGSEVVYQTLPSIKQRYPWIKVVDQLYNEYGHIENNRRHREWIDLTVVENQCVARALIEEHQESTERVRIIQNGVDVHGKYSPAKISFKAIDRIFKEYGIPQDKKIISYFGRFSPEKRPDFFIDIAEKFKDNSNLFFIMAGQGPLFDVCQARVKKKKLEEKILLPGIVESNHFMAISHIVVLPSRIDGRPNVVLESLSMGVPMVTTNVGGFPEIVQNGVTGYICECNDLEDFVSKISHLINHEDTYMAFKRAARSHAKKYFDIEKMRRDYLETFNHLLT